jgi:hypothetical protein
VILVLLCSVHDVEAETVERAKVCGIVGRMSWEIPQQIIWAAPMALELVGWHSFYNLQKELRVVTCLFVRHAQPRQLQQEVL